MKEGIARKPDWYPGLSENSTFEDVQAYLYTDAGGTCPLPCTLLTAASVQQQGLSKRSSASAADGQMAEASTSCYTAVRGEKCYDNVIRAMKSGISEHPDWFPGVGPSSSFEAVQIYLHESYPGFDEIDCKIPCACQTAKKGDTCYERVRWVLTEGISLHPDLYPNLTEMSRWEDAQWKIHEAESDICPAPCALEEWGSPSLFCFAVFRSEGYELELVKSQLEQSVGIFGCDEFAVLSDKVLKVTDSVETLIIPPCEEVGVSKDGTAANTLVFMQAWRVISTEARYKAHDWVIKADPDTVIIVDRLRPHLQPFTGENVFIQNCAKYSGPGWPMMYGSLEAFSVAAIEAYFKEAERCRTELDWETWGEDMFMGNCLTLLGARPEFDGGLTGDAACLSADCADGTTAAYHPFKSPESWFTCYNLATFTNFKLK